MDHPNLPCPPCEAALRDLLKAIAPQTLLCIADSPPAALADPAPAAEGRIALLNGSDAIRQLPALGRFDFALVWDPAGALAKGAQERMVAALRDLHAAQLALLADTSRWQESELLALGLSRLTRCAGEGPREFALWGFDLATYKTTPDWLNPRFWANPERWDKAFW